MLSVGNRDGRKGLGFGGGMEDTELEEGEACSYLDDDPTVDPDIALAYLDEKLHSVLGHFQKDFEGGVSAENLGAKFGGYGSFLPTYQRSPVASHPRTPKIQNHALRSPSNLQHEGGFQNVTTPEVAPLAAHCRDINDTMALSTANPSTTHDSVKSDAGMEHGQANKLTSRVETFKKSTLTDQKKLKFRIRVGSDNQSAQTKAEIYSGLGLHASPSSSFEYSPQSEGWSQELHDAPEESPNSILHIMTSFPLERSTLLSPLAEDLSYLTGNKKTRKGRRPDSISKSETVKSVGLAVGHGSSLNNGKQSVPKNNMSSKIDGISLELSNRSTGDVQDVISKLSRETHDEASACDELISKALRLPLLSTTEIPVGNGKVSGVFRRTNKNAVSSEVTKIEPSNMSLNRIDVWDDENPNGDTDSDENHLDQKEKVLGEKEAQPRKFLIRKGAVESPRTELNPYKEVKAVQQEITNNPTSNTDLKVGLQKEVGSLSAFKDIGSSRAKSKSKLTPDDTNKAESVKAQVRDGSSSQFKIEKNINRGSKYEAKSSKLLSDVRKSRDTYKELFGDLNSEHEENEDNSLEFPSAHGIKGSQMTDIGKFDNSLKVKATNKKVEKPMVSESHSKTGSHVVPCVSGQMHVAPAPPVPVVIEEHWVCCDSCQKWRLLPVGRLPSSLPEKWLCSMLDWLPGMNRCDIDEDETTKALVSFSQASAVPEGDKNPRRNVGVNATGALPAVIQHPSIKFNSVASIPRKKNGLTEASIAMSSHSPAGMGNLARNLQPAVKSRSWNDIKQSPSVTDMKNSYLKEPSDSVVEKNKKMSKDKQKSLDRPFDGGITKTNKKRGTGHGHGHGSPRPSKKYKNGETTDEGRIVGLHSGSVMPTVVVGEDRSKSTEAKSHIYLDASLTSSIKTKDEVRHSTDGSSDKRRRDGRDSSGKKRKAHGSQESRHSESLPTSGFIPDERKESVKESSQRHRGKEKKTRVSSQKMTASGPNREIITEQSDQAVTKNLKLAQDPNNILQKQSMEDVDSSRRELTSSHLFTEATSSSSKISGSRKSRAGLQVTEGSPVESVSSSPLRSTSKDRHTSHGKNDFDKECPTDLSGLSVSPKKYSDHEIDGKSGVIRRVKKDTYSMEKASAVAHKGTQISSVLDSRDSASGGKIKGKPAACDELPGSRTVDEVANTLDHHTCELPSDNSLPEDTYNNTLHLSNGSLPDKKGSSVRSIDRLRKSNLFDSSSQDGTFTHGVKIMDEKLSKHTPADSHKLEKKHDMKVPGENCKKVTQVKSGGVGGQGVKHHNFPSLSVSKQNLVQDHGGTSSIEPTEKMELLETSRGKSVLQSPIVGGSSTDICHTRQTSRTGKGNEIENRNVYASERDDFLQGSKPVRKADCQNGGQPTTSRHPTPVTHKLKDLNAPSPARRDSSSQSAANAVKEAKDLKHMADRVKSSGSNAESIRLYFEASLKFLLGASLLESSTSETRHGDMIQSTQMYSSTAKLCEFCANEYEKAKDMASAALAYKCTEVAYMRVVYSSHNNVNRDRHELRTALQMAPPGESPSSSASDVDNLNNAATGEKVLVAKGVSSPQVASSHVISARNRPGFARLLNFAQDVNFAMEASRKSRVALAAVSAHLEQVHNENGISSIKSALDFSFQDVEGLLQLIRIAMEAISR